MMRADSGTSVSGQFGRVRLGFICDSLEDSFQAALLDAAMAAAAEHDVDLLIVPGGKIGEGTIKNAIHELATPWVDGFVIAAHTIGHMATGSQMVKFLDALSSVPSITLGEVAGAECCLTINNEVASYTLTQHLLVQHGITRFAYLSGPAGNNEAEARESGCLRALGEAGLSLPERYRLAGDFTWEGGRDAVVELFDRRGLAPGEVQAIVCANDASAVGVCLELERRNFCIPRDIAVVGFDDTEIVSHLPAPLTTVSQPLGELLYEAMRMLLDGLRMGRRPRGSFMYGAKPVYRRSCGCPRLASPRRPSTPAPASRSNPSERAHALEEAIREDIDEAFALALDRVKPGWLSELLEALDAQLAGKGSAFHDTLEVLCFGLMRARKPANPWHNALLAVRRHVARREANDDRLALLDHMMETALRLTSEMTTSFMARQREELLEHLRVLSDATASLLAAPDLVTIANVARASFPKLGLQRGLICLLAPSTSTPTEIAAISSFGLPDEVGRAAVSCGGFGAEPFLQGKSWVVEPLSACSHLTGLAILQTGLAHASWYERLRDALTSAINGAQLVQRVQQLVVTDPLTGLCNRRLLAQRLRDELDAVPARVPLSLLVLDLDGFKALNDVRGHDEGDRALVEASESIRRCLRDTDTLGRFGGDEFVAVLPRTDAEQAKAIAMRVLSNLPRDLLARVAVPLTCSIGTATTEHAETIGETELFRLADQALLAAKRAGKNQALHAGDCAHFG